MVTATPRGALARAHARRRLADHLRERRLRALGIGFRRGRRVVRAARGASAGMAKLLAPRPGNHSILKPRHSAFFGTPLEFLLDEPT
jgi:hypothetical protein